MSAGRSHCAEHDVFHDGTCSKCHPPVPVTLTANGEPDDAYEYAAARARLIEHEAEQLRIRQAAREKVEAEQVVKVDDGSREYLDRDQLDDLPTMDPLIGGILPRHSYGVLRGRDHTFKSFVALDWSLCLATGKEWQGRPVERVPVLYIAGEGAYGITKRIAAWEQAWNQGERVDRDWFTVRKSALNLHRPNPDSFDMLRAIIEERKKGFVVVDTLRRVSGAADGNGSEMGAVVDNLDRIKQATTSGSVLAVSHTDKADNDTRGYSGIEDDADFVWHAKRDENLLNLKLTKMKDGPDGALFTLAPHRFGESLVLQAANDADVVSTESQIQLLNAMRSTFRDGAYTGQLQEASGLPSTTFYRALGELKDAGHIVNEGTRKRAFYRLTEAL